MSKQDVSEQVKFLVSCIRNAANGKPDFAAVATELEIVSKAAAQKRYERLLKAHDVNGAKAVNKSTEDEEAPPSSQSTPKKRKTPQKAAATPKKKVKAAAKTEGGDDENKAGTKPVKKEEKDDDDSVLSEPPASDGEVEI